MYSMGGEIESGRRCIEGTNLPGDFSLILSNDPKPRLRWTPELHDRFINAVAELGGPNKATPKTLLRAMGVEGLTLYHLKSHLQKYRMGRLSSKELPDSSKDASDFVGSQATRAAPSSSLKLEEEKFNDGCNEAMRVQMELQRRLHEQLEVQQHLQIRVSAQEKYLNSILERAYISVIKPDLTAAVLTNDGCVSSLCEPLILSSLSEVTASYSEEKSVVRAAQQITDCSPVSCLTSSTESPGPVAGSGLQIAFKKRSRSLFGNDESDEQWIPTF